VHAHVQELAGADWPHLTVEWGLSQALTEVALSWAWVNGSRCVYCFSTEAGRYCVARGFEECAIDEVLRELPDAPQVRMFEELGWLSTEVAFRKVL
jgi:hypothetical protein